MALRFKARLLAALLLPPLAFALGVALGYAYPSEALLEVLRASLGGLAERAGSPLELALLIYVNNLVTGAVIMALSLLVVPGLLLVLFNGYVLGLVAWWATSERGLSLAAVVAGVAPHGVVEIPAVLLASSAGLYCVFTCRSLAAAKRVLGGAVAFLAVALLIAAFIEAFITPLVLERVAGVEVWG